MLGVRGGGQLGRMFAQAAQRMGYRVSVLTPEPAAPTAQLADRKVIADYGDEDAVQALAKDVAVVTFEFENIPTAATRAAREFAPVRPHGEVLHHTQDRLRERSLLRRLGLPCAQHAPVRSREELDVAVPSVGMPAILKTAAWGYDGKGQRRIHTHEEALQAWLELGQTVAFPLLHNEHSNHILDITTCPAPQLAMFPKLGQEAGEIIRTILDGLEVVGVLCVEMFLLESGALIVNEIAPRPHNSGHVTLDSHSINQFELQVRSICGLPLGNTVQHAPAAMVNLLGDVWQGGAPNFARALELPGSHLHLYGKGAARPGRKLGHITVPAEAAGLAREQALRARDLL